MTRGQVSRKRLLVGVGINERIRVSVIIADDHPVTGHGIAQTLAAVPTIQVGAVVSIPPS